LVRGRQGAAEIKSGGDHGMWPRACYGTIPFAVTLSEPRLMPMMASNEKERPASGNPPRSEKPTQFETDRITTALRQLYGYVAAEPIPRRLVELLNRLKLRH